ncbi:imine reductase family protein [Streptomyces longispororuber]|uniref:imine reductase family protein n=1 Tax=Streptomyces longispororuber TaxID=68230 RepID=UPI00272DDF2C|nr:hypothetical protein [Streptomyces longispororuber]
MLINLSSGSSPQAGEAARWAEQRGAMEHLIEESEAVGVNAELPKLLKTMADRAIAAGHGKEQYPVLIEEFGESGNE